MKINSTKQSLPLVKDILASWKSDGCQPACFEQPTVIVSKAQGSANPLQDYARLLSTTLPPVGFTLNVPAYTLVAKSAFIN